LHGIKVIFVEEPHGLINGLGVKGLGEHALMGIEGSHDWSDGKIAECVERIESERKRAGWEKPAHLDWNWRKGNDFHKYVAREAALQPDSFEFL
jgi:hypothetical protein